jgi:hypothetical protein
MIHETKETIETLIGYAHHLTYEWGWKRGHDSADIYLREYLDLIQAINQAERLLIRLEQIDNLKGGLKK